MAINISFNQFIGSIGNITFYMLYGKNVARLKRMGLSRWDKYKPGYKVSIKNTYGIHKARHFIRAARRGGLGDRWSGHPQYPVKLRGHIYTKILALDRMHRIGEKEIYREHLPLLRQFEPSPDFSKAIANRLRNTEISDANGVLTVEIPKLYLQSLKCDHYEVWVRANRIALKTYESKASKGGSIQVDGQVYQGGKIELELGKIGENEGVSIGVGVRSFRNGERVKLRSKNGFVILGY